MTQPPLRVLAVSGSTSRNASTRAILQLAVARLQSSECAVDMLDLATEPLPVFNPEVSYQAADYPALRARVESADVYLLATPDYHGSMSGALKNFLDHFWKEFAGKLFATLVASFEKGLTVTDQVRTVARQCYAWSLPYGVSFADKADVKDGQIINEQFVQRLDMMVRDLCVYGELLARQRRADLAGNDLGFMARYRK